MENCSIHVNQGYKNAETTEMMVMVTGITTIIIIIIIVFVAVARKVRKDRFTRKSSCSCMFVPMQSFWAACERGEPLERARFVRTNLDTTRNCGSIGIARMRKLKKKADDAHERNKEARQEVSSDQRKAPQDLDRQACPPTI